jgi:cytidine deaminase
VFVLQVHAEQFLMANLVLHNEDSLIALAISAAPCGHCRQFYSELACAVSAPQLFVWSAAAACVCCSV